ncbi:MAG: Lactyl (2) diphospho-(5')guanosine:7,8-didemethyl-8-hydroxy-5-deazariboflavin 2-phospho-L-lactate transferase, partial [uncultured Pseudonocardia sp.]
EDCRTGRRGRRSPVPGRGPGGAPGRGDHRRGQRRRRHLAARAADLPRPRHLHVHPRWGDRPRARVGPRRRDVVGARRAGRLRRRPRLVRPRGQGHRHPPRPHPDAACGLPALRRHRGAVPPLAARGRAAARHRRPRGDPRRRRRPGERGRGAQGDPLPGVVDPAQGRAAGPPVRLDRGRLRVRPAGGARGDRARRRRAARPVQPRRQHRRGAGRAGRAGSAGGGAGQGGGPLTDRRRAAAAGDGRPLPGRDRRRDLRGGGGPALRRALGRRAARRLARAHRRPRGGPRRGGPRRAAADEQHRGVGADGPGRRGPRPCL